MNHASWLQALATTMPVAIHRAGTGCTQLAEQPACPHAQHLLLCTWAQRAADWAPYALLMMWAMPACWHSLATAQQQPLGCSRLGGKLALCCQALLPSSSCLAMCSMVMFRTQIFAVWNPPPTPHLQPHHRRPAAQSSWWW